MPEEYIIIRDWSLEGEDDSGLIQDVSIDPVSAAETLETENATLEKNDLEEIAREKNVVGIAPVIPLKLIEPVATEEGDEGFVESQSQSNTWGIEAVNAHQSNFDGSSINIAVLDSGIDLSHPAFAGMNIEYKNFTNGPDKDVSGHGTHCAGTIFGQDVNGKRIGIAREIDQAFIGKVLGKGGGSSHLVVDAMIWAAAKGAHVISMSLGIDFTGLVEDKIENGFERPAATSWALERYSANVQLFSNLLNHMENRFPNTVVIAASGNDSKRPKYEIAVSPPAAGKGIISVGALRKKGGKLEVARFSNDNVMVSAPGYLIQSARAGGGLTMKNGTSMATPHVAGVAALWAQKELDEQGEVSGEMITSLLTANATRNGLKAGSQTRDVGRGVVQAPI